MMNTYRILTSTFFLLLINSAGYAQITALQPVTDEMLLNPEPGDWLMYSRTYDNQRYSPLDQINRENVDRLELVWTREMYPGPQENIPLVYEGVMFVVNPRSIVQAIDAAGGDLIWEYERELPADLADYVSAVGRNRNLAIIRI